jgi:hypothetical protein
VSVERTKRCRCLAPERPYELAVISISDRSGPVVELELLEGRQSTIALLD